MYQDYFGLTEKPFHLTPNPRFLFLSKNHREVFAHLLYGIRQRVGFIEVTGEVGTGKTTVLRTLFTELGSSDYRLAVIFNPSLSAPEMLCAVAREFGLRCAGLTSGEVLAQLNDFLLAENAVGRTVVLVIDEAQNLAPAVLEQIRLLSNLETESDKLIQIVLVGQPELGKLLGRSELRQLSQRISVRYHLRPLDEEDARAYIEHRLAVAGWKGGRLFDPAALRRIFRLSGGLPRLINVYCDRALLAAYAADRRDVSAALVAQAAAELRRQGEGRWRGLRRWWLPATATLLLAIASWGLWPASPLPATPAGVVSSQDRDQGGRVALSALLQCWGRSELRAGEGSATPRDLAAAVGARGLQLLRLRGDLETLLRLDAPALLETTAAGSSRYLALLAVAGGEVRVAPPVDGAAWLPLADLARYWNGLAYLPWENALQLPTSGVVAVGDEVAALQRLLRQGGLSAVPASGRFDAETERALVRLQRQRGLTADGRPGPETLLVLYQAAGVPGVPRLSAGGGER